MTTPFMPGVPGNQYDNMAYWGQGGNLGTGTYGVPMNLNPVPALRMPAAAPVAMPVAAPNPVAAAAPNGGWWDQFGQGLRDSGFLGSTDLKTGLKTDGWGGMALGAASGLTNAFMGMQQYGLAKKTLEENKRQFQANFDAQRTTTNSALEDRQRARVASNPGAYESVGSYMDRNAVR